MMRRRTTLATIATRMRRRPSALQRRQPCTRLRTSRPAVRVVGSNIMHLPTGTVHRLVPNTSTCRRVMYYSSAKNSWMAGPLANQKGALVGFPPALPRPGRTVRVSHWPHEFPWSPAFVSRQRDNRSRSVLKVKSLCRGRKSFKPVSFVLG